MWEVVTYPDEGCYDRLANGTLVYPSQGGRYRVEGCVALRAFLLEEFLLGLLEICKCPVDEYFSP